MTKYYIIIFKESVRVYAQFMEYGEKLLNK